MGFCKRGIIEIEMECLRQKPIISQPKVKKFNYLKPRERKVFKPGEFRNSREYLLTPGSKIRRREEPFILPSFIYCLVKIWEQKS